MRWGGAVPEGALLSDGESHVESVYQNSFAVKSP